MSTKLEIPEWLGARLTVGAFSEYAKRKGGDEPPPEPNGEAAAS